jgi:site-specific recombinase
MNILPLFFLVSGLSCIFYALLSLKKGKIRAHRIEQSIHEPIKYYEKDNKKFWAMFYACLFGGIVLLLLSFLTLIAYPY